MTINSITLHGRLTADPERRKSADTPILNFSLAFDTFRAGEKQANFIDCTLFGNRAKGVAPFLRKGMPITILGKIEQQVWENKDGERRSKIAIIVNDLALPPKQDNGKELHEKDEDDMPF